MGTIPMIALENITCWKNSVIQEWKSKTQYGENVVKRLANLYQFKYETKTTLTEIIIIKLLYKYDCMTIYKYINIFNYKYNFW